MAASRSLKPKSEIFFQSDTAIIMISVRHTRVYMHNYYTTIDDNNTRIRIQAGIREK